MEKETEKLSFLAQESLWIWATISSFPGSALSWSWESHHSRGCSCFLLLESTSVEDGVLRNFCSLFYFRRHEFCLGNGFAHTPFLCLSLRSRNLPQLFHSPPSPSLPPFPHMGLTCHVLNTARAADRFKRYLELWVRSLTRWFLGNW